MENGDVKDEWSGPDEGAPEEGVPGGGILHKSWKVRQEKACLLTKSPSIQEQSFMIKGTDSETRLSGFEQPCGLTSQVLSSASLKKERRKLSRGLL